MGFVITKCYSLPKYLMNFNVIFAVCSNVLIVKEVGPSLSSMQSKMTML